MSCQPASCVQLLLVKTSLTTELVGQHPELRQAPGTRGARHSSGSSAWRRRGNLWRTAAMASCASSRASGAPRQKCAPPPNDWWHTSLARDVEASVRDL